MSLIWSERYKKAIGRAGYTSDTEMVGAVTCDKPGCVRMLQRTGSDKACVLLRLRDCGWQINTAGVRCAGHRDDLKATITIHPGVVACR